MMVPGFDLLRALKQLLRDRTGNFAILTAISVPMLVAASGVAIDVTSMSMSRSQLQEATDSAALAAATALADGTATTTTAKDLGNNFVLGQMSNYLTGDATTTNALKTGTSTTVTSSSNSSGGTSYVVNVNASYSMSANSMSRLLGMQTMSVSAASTSTSGTAVEKTALSMEIVLDKSGSMWLDTEAIDKTQTKCDQYYVSGLYLYKYKDQENPCYIKKIAALKTATGTLLDQLDAADPTSQYVRTAGIGWSDEIDLSSELDWGTKTTRNKVINKLAAGGGTESSAPMKSAYNKLVAVDEATTQAGKGNKNFQKIIVLMTDGDNNATSSDTETLKTCTDAKNKGVQIYTVAFMAPTRGQNLLRSCASSPSNYFDAKQMSDLVAAFKSIGAQAAKQMTLLTK
ncbi:pilus assembly protein TadG-related protein [Rhizobium sp. NPDC090279]|uniref:vWA domain-containing protein n=1 Tax=Rhizobium sp. NPDC090279 TaxID=3364499 RepID=UPI00383B5E70